ncbi:MAG: Arc family DNA-binding protein [Thermoanaerobaculaceae bacterium]|jgi:predicted transcriptional regulator
MATVTIKGISDAVYRRLKKVALANRRSVNREIIMRLERSLHDRSVNAEEILTAARQVRGGLGAVWITADELEAAKDGERP